MLDFHGFLYYQMLYVSVCGMCRAWVYDPRLEC